MGANWINNVDMLAGAGIIDYDAAAYVNGTAPRYAGSPEFAFNNSYGPQYRMSPSKDEFAKKKNNMVNNPSWKKALFAMIALGGIAYGGYKLKVKKLSKVAEQTKNILNKQPASSKKSI